MSHYYWTILLPAVALDLLLGDPHWMPHPVRWTDHLRPGNAAAPPVSQDPRW